MRIGIFTDTYRPQVNGVVSSIMTLEKELRKLGHKVYIITTTDPDAPKVEPNVLRLPSMEFKPFLIKLTDNSVYEGIIIILRNDISLYSYLTTEELRYFIFELERVNFTLLATELFNTYISITEKTNNQEVKSKKVVQQNSNSSVESLNSNLGYINTIPKI